MLTISTTTDSPLVYIVILNWNGWKDTVECLDSVLRLSYPRFRIVVCDNASTDGSETHFQRWATSSRHGRTGRSIRFIDQKDFLPSKDESTGLDIVFIKNQSNLGYAGGNNVALRYALRDAEASYFWILNNDTLVAEDSLSSLVRVAMQDPQIGACGSTLAYYHAKDRIQAFGGATYSPWSGMIRLVGNGSSIHQRPPQEQVEHTFSYIIGASTLFSRPALETVGLFSEDYFLFFEELDWTLRANGRFRITYAPESLVHHKEGGTTRRRDTSETSDLFALRNRLLITKRFFPLYLPSICLGMIGSMALRLVRGQWRRAFFILMLLIASLLGRKLEKMSPLTPSSQNN